MPNLIYYFSGNIFKDLYISSLQFPNQRKTKQDAKHQRLPNVRPTLLNVQFRRSWLSQPSSNLLLNIVLIVLWRDWIDLLVHFDDLDDLKRPSLRLGGHRLSCGGRLWSKLCWFDVAIVRVAAEMFQWLEYSNSDTRKKKRRPPTRGFLRKRILWKRSSGGLQVGFFFWFWNGA